MFQGSVADKCCCEKARTQVNSLGIHVTCEVSACTYYIHALRNVK